MHVFGRYRDLKMVVHVLMDSKRLRIKLEILLTTVYACTITIRCLLMQRRRYVRANLCWRDIWFQPFLGRVSYAECNASDFG